jgi:hypothetical protein
VVLRGITHDIGPAQTTPGGPRNVALAEQVVAGLAEPGAHRALVNLRSLRLLRWLDDPMPGIAWEYRPDGPQPAIHPDDLTTALRMAEGLARGKTNGVIRLRTTDGRWHPTPTTANLIILDQHTAAALVTLKSP